MQILIVDDDPKLIELMTKKLERTGFKVVSAKNGLQALDITRKNKPDLILLDEMMPEMDGFLFFKEVKKDENLATIPIIILTGRGKMRESFLAVGADDFIAKPFDSDDLVKRIEKCLNFTLSHEDQRTKIILALHLPDAAQALSKKIEQINYSVAFVTAGEEVIEKIVTFSPNVILLDVRLTGTPAHETINSIRSLSRFKDTVILIYTYLTDGEYNCGYPIEERYRIEKEQYLCHDAGANDNLGLITEVNFVDEVVAYLNKI